MATGKKCSKELKLDAISLVLDQNYSPTKAIQNLGVKADYAKPLD